MAQIKILLEKQLLTIQNIEIIASGDSNGKGWQDVYRCVWH